MPATTGNPSRTKPCVKPPAPQNRSTQDIVFTPNSSYRLSVGYCQAASLRPQPNDRQRNSHQDQCDLPAFSVAPQAGHHRYFPDDSEFPCAHLSHYAASAEILAIRRQFLLPLPPITSCRHRFGCRSAQPPAVPDRNMTISNWRTAQPPITFVPIHEGTHAHHPRQERLYHRARRPFH